jgi:hypothetical protein|tara:strand:+ start:2395 stop:2559 length:165 start_codon:yes stop_codon:yes gene_type:complete
MSRYRVHLNSEECDQLEELQLMLRQQFGMNTLSEDQAAEWIVKKFLKEEDWSYD